MIVDNVSFNQEIIRKMKKREFIKMHKVLYPNKPPEELEHFLGGIYDKIKGEKPAIMGAE